MKSCPQLYRKKITKTTIKQTRKKRLKFGSDTKTGTNEWRIVVFSDKKKINLMTLPAKIENCRDEN